MLPLFPSSLCVKMENPSVFDSHFQELTILAVKDFVDGDRDEMLLCPVRAILAEQTSSVHNVVTFYLRDVTHRNLDTFFISLLWLLNSSCNFRHTAVYSNCLVRFLGHVGVIISLVTFRPSLSFLFHL